MVSMKDIARAAGVSVCTVSLVLNGKTGNRVSERMASRVLNTAEQLGYAPNSVARTLKMRRSHVLGFITDEIGTTPYAGAILLGAQDAARRLGYILLTVNTGNDRALEHEQIATLRSHQVDGFLYALMYHRRVEVPEELHELHTVVVDGEDEDGIVPSIHPDEQLIGRDATHRLIAAGCRRIVYFGSETGILAQGERYAGYRQALDDVGLAFDPALVVNATENVNADELASRMLEELKPDGVFCFNDVRAPAVYAAARAHGLTVGRDLAVIGVDNQPFIASVLRPGLTTVELPHYEMGFEGVMRVVAMIDGPEAVQDLCGVDGDDSASAGVERTAVTTAAGALSVGLRCRVVDKGSVPPALR